MQSRIAALVARVAGVSVIAAVASPALACQLPPGSQVPCTLVPDRPVVSHTDPFTLSFTLVNFPVTEPFPPPFLDDLEFEVYVSAPRGTPDPTCGDKTTPAGEVTVDPTGYTVELDEAWSPFADEPTSDTRDITVTPLTVADYYTVFVTACAGGTACRCCDASRFCSTQVCVQAVDDPETEPLPYAELVEPIVTGAAGDAVPLALRVVRNGYTPGRPLTVRVQPENRTDPVDLFPIAPSDLTTDGYVMVGDDETIPFRCSLHFPCFVGVDNVFHVTIHDGPTLVWDSREYTSSGIGRVMVDRAPMARIELIEVEDDGGDGRLDPDEHAIVRVRAYARNPLFAVPLAAARIELPFPTELTLIGHDLHHHDNPMDTVDPTPAELEATGTVDTATDGLVIVDVIEIAARFTDGPFAPPRVFYDLFEVDLELETPPGGLPAGTDLVFGGVTVTGTASGVPKAETSPPVTLSVTARLPPNPTGTLYAVRAGAAVRLEWDDSAVDASHGAAESYTVYRSLTAPDAGYEAHLTVADSAAVTETATDPLAIDPATPRHFYRVSAFNGDGHSGDIPPE